ncbi:DUF998 domain-containing protein [Actinocatenispora rupis]|uniref:DUF998 domain-containing protein n=1 Tax=Actinocatenispora rupis TaxID=519421 RepID=A0A8J3J6F1_9ACTN|nr:DUF998 domain-containing protein [Actinocatenispora rupis]GID12481.1 hypothetical protein Aru02nite_33700 [Actinocatenispora rupis]
MDLVLNARRHAAAIPTRALLVCGVAAGPIYFAVTSAQALTRDGFDPSRHTWNVLTAGDLGWIQRSNLLLMGVLTVLFAVGVRRVLGDGWGGRWASRLLVLHGVGQHITGAVFQADPQPGFPPGTPPETTWHGMVHYAARSGGYAVLLAASLLIAGWFATEQRRRGLAWLALAVVPPLVAAASHTLLADSVLPMTGGAAAGNSTPTAVFIVLTLAPTLVWLTTLAGYLYRRARRGAVVVTSGAAPTARIGAQPG